MMIWKEKRDYEFVEAQNHCGSFLPFLIFGAMIFPILNNMDALVSSADTVQEPRIQSGQIIPEYQAPDDLGGAAREETSKK
ncbi:MAG: hypothetical protein CM15mP130_0590 [Verrucomicrobiota bacterium]|nr:MAG: hypothetical protein CM15mP130_0590 [Verrucomicrobiota bacterium]